MSYHQPNCAPEGCRAPLCASLEQRITQGVPHDRCLAGVPMHEGCAWHRTPAAVAALAARDQDLVLAARQSMGRKP